MNSRCYMLSQVLDLAHRQTLDRLVERHDARPGSDRSQCGGRESKFLLANIEAQIRHLAGFVPDEGCAGLEGFPSKDEGGCDGRKRSNEHGSPQSIHHWHGVAL